MRGSFRLLGLGVVCLSSCSPDLGQEGHDKAYYAQHGNERAAVVAKCANDPGRLYLTSACINARGADADVHAGHFYDAPPPRSRVLRPDAL